MKEKKPEWKTQFSETKETIIEPQSSNLIQGKEVKWTFWPDLQKRKRVTIKIKEEIEK
jgi:hypothetical protein